MRHYRFRKVIVLLAAISQSLVPTLSDAGEVSEEQLLIAAKSTLVSQIESGLPDQAIEAWLGSLVGKDMVWSWGLNDCGEQTGVPEIDNERDLPICAGLEASKDDRQIFLYFLVGFNSMGVTSSRGLYFVGISDRGSISSFESLSSLAAYLRNEQE